MTFKTDDRVFETSITTGTGTYTLDGAQVGFTTFSGMGANNHCPYFATDDINWEVGIGAILTGPARLERTTILRSSNADAAVNWGAGTRKIRCGWPAAMAIPRTLSRSVAGAADVTLTTDEQRRKIITLTGALTGNINVIVDATPWDWIVYNNTSGAYTLTFKTTAGSGIAITQGTRTHLECDGTNVVSAITGLNDLQVASLTSTGAVSGTTGTFTDTTDATSSTTGPLKTAGGLAVAKKAYIGGAATIGDGATISKASASEGQSIALFNDPGSENIIIYSANTAGANAAATGMSLPKNSSTSRSINAAGTINASGADYAEYERKADWCGIVEKGQIIGIDAYGKIVDRWTGAVCFGVKSSDPTVVGGDVWGSESALGIKRPVEPQLADPAYTGPDKPKDASDEAALQTWQAALLAWEQEIALAKLDHDANIANYEIALGAFNVRLEEARQRVDRIAYCGKVPVNVIGAKPGDYIVAAEGPNDAIIAVIVTKAQIAADMSMMLDAVGRVRRILDDGRAEVAVIVH